MKKELATYLGGAAVLVLTIFPLLLSQEQLAMKQWRDATVALGVFALVATAMQAKWARDADRKAEARERERDKLLCRIADLIAELARREGHRTGRGGRTERAAHLASYLLNLLVDEPDVSEFNLFARSQLHEQLTQSFTLQNVSCPPNFATSPSRDAIRGQAEKLLVYALSGGGEENDGGQDDSQL